MKVSIAVPCFNRPEGLKATLECLQAQTHRDWQVLICDNASTDPEVAKIARNACARDPRIRYMRHVRNIGASANFRFGMLQAENPLFMWASDDDLWDRDFLAELVRILTDQPECSMAAASIDNINRHGRPYRNYPDFSLPDYRCSVEERVRRFVMESEVLGKANLIYGLFRTDDLRRCVEETWHLCDLGQHGGDVVFLLGFLCRYRAVVSPRVLLHKRVDTDRTHYKLRRDARTYFVPLGQYASYRRRMMAVAPDEHLREVVSKALLKRLTNKYLYRIPTLGWFGSD